MKVDIERLALLARIKLDSKEKAKFQKEFEAILNYISKLEEVDVGKLDEFESSKTVDAENVVQEDEGPHEGGKFSDDLLKQAPETEKGYVKVKHVLE